MLEITLVILVFKSFNALSLVAYTMFSHVPIKKSNGVNSGKHESHGDHGEAMGIKVILKKMKIFFFYLKIVANFVVKNYSITIFKTRYMKLNNIFYRLFLSQIQVTNFLKCTWTSWTPCISIR